MVAGKRLKWFLIAFVIASAAGALTFAARGPYTSNYLKKLMLRELQNATGRQVIAERIYLNFFPLFVGADGIKVFDEGGRRLLSVGNAKAYVGLSGLLRREIEIRRLYIGSPELWTDAESLRDVIENIRKFAEKKTKKKAFKLRIKAIEVGEGKFNYYDGEKEFIASGEEVSGLIKLREAVEVGFSVKDLSAAYKDMPEFKGAMGGLAFIKKDVVELKSLRVSSFGSELSGSGSYALAGLPSGVRGEFKAEIGLLVESVKKLFGLRKSGEGRIHASGSISFAPPEIMDPTLDFSLRGNFYLETLLELLGAKTTTEELSGLASFSGHLSGRLSDFSGTADARLKKASLYGVLVDDLRCKVYYGDGALRFSRARAKLYGGEGQAELTLSIPKVKPYSLSVRVKGIQSAPLLGLIHLSGLRLSDGRVEGELFTSGEHFNPSGKFIFNSVSPSGDVIGRVRRAEGRFDMYNGVVALKDMSAITESSELSFSGVFNTVSKEAGFKGRLSTRDIKDVTSPYFERLGGSAVMEASLSGIINEPAISASIRASGLRADGYMVGEAFGEADYRKGLLDIKKFDALESSGGIAATHSLSGRVLFPGAEGPFDVREPEFDLSASARGISLSALLGVAMINAPLEGVLDSDIRVEGKAPMVSGTASLASAKAYGFPLDSASLGFSYDFKDFTFDNAVIKKGGSSVTASGGVSKDRRFDFKASSEDMFLSDILIALLPETPLGADYKIAAEAEGKGTFDEPEVRLSARLTEGTIGNSPAADGFIKASVSGKAAALEAELFGGMLRLSGEADLSGEMPWRAELVMAKGRYDFLMRALMKNVPPDSLLSLQGSASLRGTRDTIEAEAVINRLNIALYEQEFSNDSDIRLKASGRKITLDDRVLMRGDGAAFSIGGGLEIRKSYDMSFEGRASLLPLAGLSSRIEAVGGKADFVFSLKGDWDKPSINGGIDVTDGSFGVRGFPQKFSSINGYVYLDENRIVIDKMSARSGGGEIDSSGVVYLKGFGIEKIYLDSLVNEVSVSLKKDLSMNFGGNLILKGTPDALDVTGEVSINRALYKERIEWKSWLISTKRTEVVRAETLLDRVRLNVRVFGSENIRIDNNLARASLKVDMVAKGTMGHPVFYGRLEAREGRVYFRNNEFKILNATADFSGTSRAGPYFVVLAETFSGGYHIWLTLEGHMEKFDLTLRSDPPLDEVSILSLLTVGEFGEQLSGLEGGIGAYEAASFLTGKYQDVIEERFRDITGLDRFQIDPYVSKSTGSVVPKVTVSKRLMGERLFVTYSSAVGVDEEQVLKLEYLLGRNLSLVGVRDERGSVGGDIKFRFKFK